MNWTPEELQGLVDDHPIVLFMKGSPNEPQCGFSNRAAQVLQTLGEEFASVNSSDLFYRSEVVESTYRVCMAYSYLDHNLFEASWSQRYTINLAPMGADNQLSLDGTAAPVIDSDPTSVLQLEQVDESKPGSASQWRPGADPEVMGRAVARLHGRATLAAGGSDLAVYRKSGNAESAYAMAITREMQREAQVAMAPRMAPSDRLLADRVALAANILVPGVFPAGADWRVRYYALPPQREELERLSLAVDLGALTVADLRMAVDPFASPEEVARATVVPE